MSWLMIITNITQSFLCVNSIFEKPNTNYLADVWQGLSIQYFFTSNYICIIRVVIVLYRVVLYRPDYGFVNYTSGDARECCLANRDARSQGSGSFIYEKFIYGAGGTGEPNGFSINSLSARHENFIVTTRAPLIELRIPRSHCFHPANLFSPNYQATDF